MTKCSCGSAFYGLACHYACHTRLPPDTIHMDFATCSLEDSLAEVSFFHWTNREDYIRLELGQDVRLDKVAARIDEYLDAE